MPFRIAPKLHKTKSESETPDRRLFVGQLHNGIGFTRWGIKVTCPGFCLRKYQSIREVRPLGF